VENLDFANLSTDLDCFFRKGETRARNCLGGHSNSGSLGRIAPVESQQAVGLRTDWRLGSHPSHRCHSGAPRTYLSLLGHEASIASQPEAFRDPQAKSERGTVGEF